MGLDIFDTAIKLEKLGSISKIYVEAGAISSILRVKDDLKEGVELLESHIRKNNHCAVVALVIAMMIVDPDGAVARIRRNGTFSLTKYQFRAGGIRKAIEAILILDPELSKLQQQRKNYLLSLNNLVLISRDAEKIYRRLVARLVVKRKFVLKTLLAYVNHLFSIPWSGNPEMPSNDLRRWSQEDMAGAYSYIFSIMREKLKISPLDWQHVDESMASNLDNSYGEILMDAAVLNEIREAESKIQSMPYIISVEEGSFRVFSENEDFDKTVQLGYIQTTKQVYIRARGVQKRLEASPSPSYTSIEEFVGQEFNDALSEFVVLVTQPVKRVVVGVPNFVFPILTGDFLFPDEMVSLVGLSIDNYQAAENDPRDILIGRNLSAGDAIYIQRYFRFVSAMFGEYFKSAGDPKKDRILKVRSTLPMMKADMLLQQLSMLIGEEKAEEAIELLSLDSTHKFIDVQYRPFIKSGDWYVLAPALIGSSNLARNIAIANGLRQKQVDSQNDPMQNAVASALMSAGFKVETGYIYNIDGRRETDIICWRDGCLFIFECKNSYLPCSAHELSNTFEHLKTAEKQLTIRKNWLEKPGNKERLVKSLEWDVLVTEVHTAVITANRLFTGYKQGEHPSRQAHEFINVILRGKIEREGLEPISFWKTPVFTAQDLVFYLNDGGIARTQLDRLQVLEVRTDAGSSSMTKLMYFDVPDVPFDS
ncbi:hypothetical protein [Pseudomonas sp. RA_5y_Pfl1_P24]|uniref:hypothetical protein n=1 Tax=Pseudomonas sp. RA_5y_Pfl1_P24 TaxID=3088706 RepID=UPI0030DBC1E8